MEKERKNRYLEKIQYIMNSIDEIEQVLPSPSGIALKGVFYNLTSSIDACLYLIAMLSKDLGIVPQGDYENIQQLRRHNFIDENLANELIKCNGLRNFLVHRYNGIDDAIVLESIPFVKAALMRFIELLEAYLNES